MPDKVLICQNCHNPFVYSEYEQINDTKENKAEPVYCAICKSIKAQEKKRPKKPSQ
ncbi:MAG TPA: zinc-ribbon domain containing protein [Spirochaetia bacterium]|nr:zinc-ribbon domain containing protein [Spirochaetia bacterium]